MHKRLVTKTVYFSKCHISIRQWEMCILYWWIKILLIRYLISCEMFLYICIVENITKIYLPKNEKRTNNFVSIRTAGSKYNVLISLLPSIQFNTQGFGFYILNSERMKQRKYEHRDYKHFILYGGAPCVKNI